VERLYEIRRKLGMQGRHPADICQNKNGKNCHNCIGGGGSGTANSDGGTEDLVASITQRVMEQLGL